MKNNAVLNKQALINFKKAFVSKAVLCLALFRKRAGMVEINDVNAVFRKKIFKLFRADNHKAQILKRVFLCLFARLNNNVAVDLNGKEIEATAEVGDMLIELKDIKEKSKTLENRQKEIEDNLKLFFGDAESIVDGNGKTLATWKAPKPSEKFDAKAFQTDHPEECAAYIRQVQGARRLLIK